MTDVKERPLLMTGREVAAMLHMSLSTLYAMSRDGRLPFKGVYFGRTVRFRRSDIESFVDGIGE